MIHDARFDTEPPRTAEEKAKQPKPEPDYDYAKTDVWLRDENGKSFIEYLYKERQQHYNRLMVVSGDQNLGFLQGQLRIINWLLRLREES
jgi:hypothetical protein